MHLNKTNLEVIQKNDDIIVKITSTAICGSDLHLIHSRVRNLPHGFVLGHEAMGIVEEAGMFGYSESYGGYDGGQAEYLRVPYANVGPKVIPENLADEQVLFLTDILPTSLWGVDMAGDRVPYRLNHAKRYGVETVNIEDHDNTGLYLKEITHGGADEVIDCVGMDGAMSVVEAAESFLKLQGGSKSAIEIASEAVRKCGTVMMVGVYEGRYNLFPLGNFFARNITLKMGNVLLMPM